MLDHDGCIGSCGGSGCGSSDLSNRSPVDISSIAVVENQQKM